MAAADDSPSTPGAARQRGGSHDDDLLVQRWLRLQVRVRCGLSTEQPDCVSVYLQLGRQVARRRLRPAVTVHLRMLRTLLAVVRDDALPWGWRRVCLEHLERPLVELATSLGVHDPLGMQSIEAAVQRARQRFPPAPRDGDRRFGRAG